MTITCENEICKHTAKFEVGTLANRPTSCCANHLVWAVRKTTEKELTVSVRNLDVAS